MAAEEPLALLAVHQGGTLEQQGRREDVAGDGGEDVDGGAHGWSAGRWDGWTVGRMDGGFFVQGAAGIMMRRRVMSV